LLPMHHKLSPTFQSRVLDLVFFCLFGWLG
jgi:hypothetical protein